MKFKNNLINVSIAGLFLSFLYAHLNNLLITGKFSLLISIISEAFLVIMFLIRKDPISVTSSIYDYIIALYGTFAILFCRQSVDGDLILGQVFLVVGGLMLLYSYISLNKSFGIVAANRGIKTTGAYSLVRHPIYLSYFVIYIGYLINNSSTYNIVLVSSVIALQIIRIIREEAHLRKDNKYLLYCNRVHWRLIPNVF